MRIACASIGFVLPLRKLHRQHLPQVQASLKGIRALVSASYCSRTSAQKSHASASIVSVDGVRLLPWLEVHQTFELLVHL